MNIVQGDYILARDANGPFGAAVYLVESLDEKTASLRVTSNCVPIGAAHTIPFRPTERDSWVVVTSLVFAANSAILPKKEIQFVSTTASMYRNLIPASQLVELSGEQAINKICFLGQKENGQLKFTNKARYVVGFADGYYAVYDEFCTGNGSDVHTLKISQFRGMRLYNSVEIVESANKMYAEDKCLGEKYTEAIRSSVAKSTDARPQRMAEPGLNTLSV